MTHGGTDTQALTWLVREYQSQYDMSYRAWGTIGKTAQFGGWIAP